MSQALSTTESVPEQPPPETAAAPGRLRDYLELSKPRITIMVVLTAWVGYAMAVAMENWNATVIAAMTAGVGLTCISSGILNQVWERNADARMQRTATRPLAAGRISVTEGILIGLITAALGTAILYAFATPLAAWLALATLLTYVLIYTPLKAITPWSTHLGAIPGAMPPFIGYAAGAGVLSLDAWPAFLIMLVWQIPHFMAIAWLYRNQYAAAGLKMLPVVDTKGSQVSAHVVVTSLLLIAAAILPLAGFGTAGLLYAIIALGTTIAFAATGIWFAFNPCDKRAKVVFLTSLLYLPIVLSVLAWDRT
ncbi:heme o synthase [Mucisphaera sp.]|uniref:heme o synthase n=1 Tax=Mucisphaera sp. TaxID=2913024 RepID=UPI003D133D51